MVAYNEQDLQEGLSKLVRAEVESVRDGGLPSATAQFEQVFEVLLTVLALNPGAFYHLTTLIRNRLAIVVSQEIALIEDMLADISDSRTDNVPVERDLTIDLTRATSILGRSLNFDEKISPVDTSRVLASTDRARAALGDAITSDGQFKKSRIEASTSLTRNFAKLERVHATLERGFDNLRVLREAYTVLGIQDRVFRATATRARALMESVTQRVNVYSDVELQRRARGLFLDLTSVSTALSVISRTNPTALPDGLNQDGRGIYENGLAGSSKRIDLQRGTFTLEAFGDRAGAELRTGYGPWLLNELQFSTLRIFADGIECPIDLTLIKGPGIHSTLDAPFSADQLDPSVTWPGPSPVGNGVNVTATPPPPVGDYSKKNRVHLVADPNVYELRSQQWGAVLFNEVGTFKPVTDLMGSPATDGTFESDSGSDVLQAAALLPYIPGGFRPRFHPTSGNFYNDFYNAVRAFPPVHLSFKHLGAQVFFSPETLTSAPLSVPGAFVAGAGFGSWNIDGQVDLEDSGEAADVDARRFPHVYRPRIITELAYLFTSTVINLDSAGWVSVVQGNVGPHLVGAYIRKSDNTYPLVEYRYEIIDYDEDIPAVRIDFRGDTPFTASVTFHGSLPDRTEFCFAPDLLADTNQVADTQTSQGLLEDTIGSGGPRGPFNIPDTVNITIGPTIKTALIVVPPRDDPAIPQEILLSLDDIVASLSTGVDVDNPYAHASFHFTFRPQLARSNRLTIEARSRHLPTEYSTTKTFTGGKGALQAPIEEDGGAREFPGPYPLQILRESAFEVLGFEVPAGPDPEADAVLSHAELASAANQSAALSGAPLEAEVDERQVHIGFLTTNPDRAVRSTRVSFATGNVPSAITRGVVLVIEDGTRSGEYPVLSVGPGPYATVYDLQRGFVATETVTYRAFSRRVVFRSTNAGPGSRLVATTASAFFGMTPNSTVYGTCDGVRAVNRLGDVLDLSKVPTDALIGGVGGVSEAASTFASLVDGVSSEFRQTEWNVINPAVFSFELLERNLSFLDSPQRFAKYHELKILKRSIQRGTAGSDVTPTVSRSLERDLTDLLANLTQTPPRLGVDYKVDFPIYVVTLEGALSAYTAPGVPSLDAALEAISEFGFDRLRELLVTGDIGAALILTGEDASFASLLTRRAAVAANDLPSGPTTLRELIRNIRGSVVRTDNPPADTSFEDPR